MYISRITKDDREQLTKQHLQGCTEYAHTLSGKLSVEFIEYLRHSHQEEKLGHRPTGRGSVIHTTQGAKLYMNQI